jgi:hypothetical protein
LIRGDGRVHQWRNLLPALLKLSGISWLPLLYSAPSLSRYGGWSGTNFLLPLRFVNTCRKEIKQAAHSQEAYMSRSSFSRRAVFSASLALLTLVAALMLLHHQSGFLLAVQGETQTSPTNALPAFFAGSEPQPHTRMQEAFGKMPLYFIENRGLMDARVAKDVQGQGKTMGFTAQGITSALSDKVAKLGLPHTLRSAYLNCVSKPIGLIAWWPGDGNANDIAGSNHGTLQNGSGFATGLVGQSFSFDGVDDYVSVPDSQSLDSITNAISVEGWINPQQPISPPSPGLGLGVGVIFARRDPGVSEGFRIDLFADGRLSLVVRTSTSPTAQGSIFVSSNSVIQFNGQWKHLVATADTTTGQVKLFVNGQDVALTVAFGPSAISGQISNVDNLFIGRRQSADTQEGAAGAAHYSIFIVKSCHFLAKYF